MSKVTIVITNYNYSKYLNRSIRSAFVQNYPVEKYEVIVVDDSSTDWSKEIIESYGELIRKVYLRTNRGLSAARNCGIKEASGEYILFLDADDYLNRDILFIESLYLDLNPECNAVACDYYLIDDQERIIGRNSCLTLPIACGIMFRRQALIDVGMYDESLVCCEDEDIRMRFQKKYAIEAVRLPLYRYRRHAGNLTNNGTLMKKYRRKVMKKHRAGATHAS